MSRSVSHQLVPMAAAAAVAAMAALVIRYVVSTPEEDALREFLVVSALIATATAVVFGRVVPRALARGGSARTALTLSLLGLLLAAAFWLGLSPVLAIGGIVVGLRSQEGENAGMARAAVAVGTLALAANVAMLVVDGVTA